MELRPQIPNPGFHEGVIVEEKIRALQSHIVQPSETLNILANLGGKGREHLLTETVMGITGRHTITSHFLSIRNLSHWHVSGFRGVLLFSRTALFYTKGAKNASGFMQMFRFDFVDYW